MEDLRSFYKKAIYVFENSEEKSEYNQGYIDGLKFALDALEYCESKKNINEL